MAFDECPPSTASRDYIQNSVERTYRWLVRCKNEMEEWSARRSTLIRSFWHQSGEDIRIENAKEIAKLDLDGYAVGGLAVGESHEEMYRILDEVVPYLPGIRFTRVSAPAVWPKAWVFDCKRMKRTSHHVYRNGNLPVRE